MTFILKNKIFQSIIFAFVICILISSFYYYRYIRYSTLLENDYYISLLLDDFLSFDAGKDFVTREDILPLLYDIQDSKQTVGRAIHIGDNLFLTAQHVVDKKDSLQIIYQKNRGELSSHKNKIEVLTGTWDYDLALIRTQTHRPTGEALLHLREVQYKPQDTVSQFLHYTGPSKHPDFILSYDGLDYYDNVRIVKNLGEFRFEKNSPLFEKRGTIWHLRSNFFKAIGMNQGVAKINSATQYFTSIPVFPGESGSGVFFRLEDSYALMGITIIAWAVDHDIQTLGHPLGYETVQQSSNFIVRSNIIAKFIKEYLQKHSLNNK